MTRLIHDQFAKQYLAELLSNYGEVQTSKELPSEIKQIDVLFIPNPEASQLDSLGLLGRLAKYPSIFEPFRNPITIEDVRSCMGKLFEIIASLARKALRENLRLNEDKYPHLWILSPTASKHLLNSFSVTSGEIKGIYLLGSSLKTGIIVIHQLPQTGETLWLRILGRGRVQQKAIEELQALPEDDPNRKKSLELVYNLYAILKARQNLESDERELIMTLAPIYQQELAQQKQEGLQQGKLEGLTEERRLTIETLLIRRFSVIDEQLSSLIEPLSQLPPSEFIPLLLQSSREELLERFA